MKGDFEMKYRTDKLKDNRIFELDNLYPMKREDIDKFATCAAFAYQNYPLFDYLMHGKYDYEIVKKIISSSIYAMPHQAVGFSTDEQANACAIFVPPNYTGSKTIPFLANGGIQLAFLSNPSIFLRLLNYENYAMKLKKEYTNHECWYLYNLVVNPKFQNQGNCSKLLNPMFAYLDRINQDCYLETHDEKNIALYEHFNFELLDEAHIPKTKVKHYAMLRKAR